MKGFGSVYFHLKYGQIINLRDVLYVSGLKKNLIPIFSMEDNSFKVTFINGNILAWQG